jgi:hypothetical protein
LMKLRDHRRSGDEDGDERREGYHPREDKPGQLPCSASVHNVCPFPSMPPAKGQKIRSPASPGCRRPLASGHCLHFCSPKCGPAKCDIRVSSRKVKEFLPIKSPET